MKTPYVAVCCNTIIKLVRESYVYGRSYVVYITKLSTLLVQVAEGEPQLQILHNEHIETLPVATKRLCTLVLNQELIHSFSCEIL